MIKEAEFDQFAEEYDAALAEGLSVSGEDKDYFARGRMNWLADQLRARSVKISAAMDYGCGTGSSTPFFFELLKAESLVGVDVSQKSLEVAGRKYGSMPVQFQTMDEYEPKGEIDLAFCNGVFHHIPVEERAAAVDYVFRSLRPGGLFSFWENNPWNPGTRYVMSKCPFDEDAVTLTPLEARTLLRKGGFEILRIDFLFIFPRALRWFRVLEPAMSRLPAGAQYQVLCRKP